MRNSDNTARYLPAENWSGKIWAIKGGISSLSSHTATLYQMCPIWGCIYSVSTLGSFAMSCNVLDTTVKDEKNRTSRVDCIGKVSSMTNSVVDFPATSYFCTFVVHDVQGASLVHHVHETSVAKWRWHKWASPGEWSHPYRFSLISPMIFEVSAVPATNDNNEKHKVMLT